MSEWEGSDAFAAEIHAAFATAITYKPPGGELLQLSAVYSNEPAPTFDGMGATHRTISWEVRQDDIAEPQIEAEIEGAGKSWRVIDITRRDDVGAWVLIVERSA